MERSLLQLQLDQVRQDLQRAHAVFGEQPFAPPSNIVPDESVVKPWIH